MDINARLKLVNQLLAALMKANGNKPITGRELLWVAIDVSSVDFARMSPEDIKRRSNISLEKAQEWAEWILDGNDPYDFRR